MALVGPTALDADCFGDLCGSTPRLLGRLAEIASNELCVRLFQKMEACFVVALGHCALSSYCWVPCYVSSNPRSG